MPRAIGSRRIASFEETVFAVYTRLAQEHKAVNLGQGFPDFDPPDFVVDELQRAARGYQQYAPLPGLPGLSGAVAAELGRELKRDLDPVANIQITVGATEALFAAAQALLDPGDEVILFEPFYDAYPADVIMAGGAARYVPLHPQRDGNWLVDPDELAGAFTNRTRAVILNTPHNPTGKVYSDVELDLIIELAAAHDAVIVSDEVYEHICFAPLSRPAARPGGWERTLTISSLGKTFSVTGWKIGWAVGPPPLIHALRMAHQWIPFAVATPLQQAAAALLAEAGRQGYYRQLRETYLRKRDILVQGLDSTPFRPLDPMGGYFVMAETHELGYAGDVELCLDLPRRAGVVGIPPSAFYSDEHKHLAKHLVRFAFCKSDDALRAATERLRQATGSL